MIGFTAVRWRVRGADINWLMDSVSNIRTSDRKVDKSSNKLPVRRRIRKRITIICSILNIKLGYPLSSNRKGVHDWWMSSLVYFNWDRIKPRGGRWIGLWLCCQVELLNKARWSCQKNGSGAPPPVPEINDPQWISANKKPRDLHRERYHK